MTKFTGHVSAAAKWLKYNGNAIGRFFVIAGSMAAAAVFISILVIGIVVIANLFTSTPEDGGWQLGGEGVTGGQVIGGPSGEGDGHGGEGGGSQSQNPDDDQGGFLRPPARTNFLFVGLDQGARADAIMVGTFYRDSGNIHLMSIPRDMLVRIPEHRHARMRDAGIHPPRTLKVTEMRAHGGRLHGIHFLQEQIAEMLGVDFHFFVEVELAAFRAIVDIIGPIEMNIPRRLSYEDPYATPPLVINVPAGRQRLDGTMAEGVVRYRGWPTGDLQRNQMQMEFMTALIQQMLTREAMLADPLGMINIVISHVNSNIGLAAVNYVFYIGNISEDSISTFTMPGSLGWVQGIEYFIPDTARLPAVLADVFHSIFEVPEEIGEEAEIVVIDIEE